MQSSVTRTLGANLENLTLTGSSAINATGNTLANILTGNSAANVLDGKTGADKMIGGAGNDTYIVDNAGDMTTEGVGAGVDLVKASINWTLANNLENLTLTGGSAISGTGNNLNNVITGNGGANTLSGLNGADTISGGNGADTLNGGVGHDTLTGGAAADKFLFTGPIVAANSDTITDFSHAQHDKIQLENAVFTALGAGTGSLAAAKFFVGASAHDADDRIIYNSATGQLYYDSDGNGAHAKVLIATLTGHPTLVASDIAVI